MARQFEQKPQPDQFMEYVQIHERAWGSKMYPGRPKLAEILNSPVVVFWRSNKKQDLWTITLHAELKQIETYFLKLLFRSSIQPINKSVLRIFKDQKRVVIRGVNIIFGEPPEKP